MFDPEKVRRFDWNTGDRKVNGEHVLASDYDQLLVLYRHVTPIEVGMQTRSLSTQPDGTIVSS
jgi:hypothetical protein